MIVVGIDADSASAGVNVRVIRRGHFILPAIGCVHHNRHERRGEQPLSNIAGHGMKLANPRR